MNTTFTNYAEKKAKQFFNLLQGYTKGIRITAILILLLMGVSNAWAGNDFTQGVVVYFDNTVTQWSSIYLRVGHSKYSSAYQVTSKVSGTDALYKYTLPSWGGYDAFSFANKSGRTGNYTIYQPSNYKYSSNYPSGQTTYFSGWNLDKRRLFIPKSVSNTDNDCTYYNTDIEYDNYQRTVTITSPTNGSITVTYKDESDNSQSETSGNFKVAQTCIITVTATPNSGYELSTLTVGGSNFTSGNTYIVRADATIAATFTKIPTNSLTVKAGAGIESVTGSKDPVTLNSTYPITATPITGYTFSEWTADPIDNATFENASSKNTNVTVQNGAVTVTATATENTHDVIVSYKYGSTTIKDNTTTAAVGEVNAKSITAPSITGYTFKEWTLGDGITNKSANTTTNPISITTKESGNYTLTANYDVIPCNFLYGSSKPLNNPTDGGKMSYDPNEKAYYIDVTTNTTPYYFRFKYNSSIQYSCDWSEYPTGKEIKADGVKVDCDKEVTGWENKSALEFNGANGSAIRIWFDYTNKKAWITTKTYTVTVQSSDINMGTVTPTTSTEMSETIGGSITAEPKPGYKFTNWTIQSGSGSFTNENAASTNFKPTEESTIQANFEANQYTITWNANGGTVDPTTSTYTYDGDPVNLPNPTRTGCSFNGWFTESTGGTQITEIGINNKPTSDVTYYAQWTIPAPTTDHIATRVYEEETINGWIAAGNGAQATPYQFYNDETVRLTITPLTEVAGLTAYYKVGETEQTANTFDLTTITTEITPITITTYYKNNGVITGEQATTTIYFQQVLTPEMVLLTTPGDEISLGSIQDGNAITLSYSATYNGYSGSVTITQDQIIGNTTTTTTLTTTREDKYIYTYTNTSLNSPCIIAFTAQTTEQHGRIFKAHTEVAVYKNVTIKVYDPNSILSNVYMWRGDDAGAADVKTEWPGESFAQHFGTWRVFVVKYPYYDHFIVNGGSNENQTFNYEIPSENTCYQLSDNKVTQNEFTNYELTETNCPGDLAVSNIDNITLTEREQKIVVPSIQVSLGNKLSDVTATVSSANTDIATAIMSGTNIIVYGHEVGSTTITVNYTLHGEKVTETFQVTVEKDTHITIQVKVPNSFGDDAQYQWSDNAKVKIHYWWGNFNGQITMQHRSMSDSHNYYQASVPLDETELKINFMVYYEYMDANNARWRQTDKVYNVSQDGCYLLHREGVQNTFNRGIEYGNHCFEVTDEYQIKIVMQNGKEYSSNVVTSTSDILSFFAPGKDEVNYHSGVVMLYKNDNLHTTIDPEIFTESNVYTAQVNNDGTGLTNVAVYTGEYYVRTYGNGDWGMNTYQQWDDNQRKERKFTYFVPREEEFYDHYWVFTLNYYAEDDKDVCGYVANIYNNDLAGKLTSDKTTDANGKISLRTEGQTANIRFGYNPRTNYFGRAILKGSGEHQDYLNLHCDNAYSDENCTTKLPTSSSVTENKFTDVSNWVYQKEFYVKIDNNTPSAKLYIDATAYNSSKSHLLGYKTNEITGVEDENQPNERTIVGAGTSNGIYHMLVVYDFKTNRIITAWSIVGNIDINDPIIVNSDLLIIRHENAPAPQVNLKDDGMISSIDKLYFAMELDRGDSNKDNRHEEQYFFSLPFDCLVGSISGVPGYMEIWGLQRYRGDLRAKNGLYLESPTYWEWMKETDIIKAGEGYVLIFDKKNATWNEFEGKSILRLYFPSMTEGFDLKQFTGSALTRTYPSHKCTLELHNRYLYDSNWKMIGTMSYNNSKVTQASEQDGYTSTTEYPSFRYKYEYEMSNDNKKFTYNYTAEDGKTSVYQSFYGYMVQFEGTISWSPINETVPEQIAARRNVNSEFSPVTMRIELANIASEMQDQAFVALDEEATTTFDQNKDLNKIFNSGKANIYTLSEGIPFAGNTLPMEEVFVPVGVQIAAEGEYTFRMPDGTEGIVVELVDYETNTRTNLLLSDYIVTLPKGTNENRFALHIQPQKDVVTSLENIGEGVNNGEAVNKYLIDGKLIIRTAEGAVYDAQGHVVQ